MHLYEKKLQLPLLNLYHLNLSQIFGIENEGKCFVLFILLIFYYYFSQRWRINLQTLSGPAYKQQSFNGPETSREESNDNLHDLNDLQEFY